MCKHSSIERSWSDRKWLRAVCVTTAFWLLVLPARNLLLRTRRPRRAS